MPTSGGYYFFVSRSLGPAFGAISGVGIWLSLTFAIAFYLYGLGEYMSQFLPLTAFWGAVIGGVLLTVVNIIGAKESEDVTGGLLDELEEYKDDLVIIGASHKWSIRNVLFGTIPDIIADRAPCSVLMVRRYVTEDWKLIASESVKRVKEQLGMTTSPDPDKD